jgi:hypothetical protein
MRTADTVYSIIRDQNLVMNRWKAVCMETCKHGVHREAL